MTEPDASLQLLQQNRNLQASLTVVRARLVRLQRDPITGLMGERMFTDWLDAILLDRLTQVDGAKWIINGRSPDQLGDDEFEELMLAVVFTAPTYPNPFLMTEPIHRAAVRSLARGLKDQLDSTLGVQVQMDGEKIALPNHFAGRVGRWVAGCFADTPSNAFRITRDASSKLYDESVASVAHLDITSHGNQHFRLVFRADDGGALLTETLVAMQAWKQLHGIPEEPACRVELAREIMLGIARTRAEHSQRLASLALQARLRSDKKLLEKMFRSCFPMINRGDLVVSMSTLDSMIAECKSTSANDGPTALDLERLERAVEEAGDRLVQHQLDLLGIQLIEFGTDSPSALEFRRLVLLAAHNRLGEFGQSPR